MFFSIFAPFIVQKNHRKMLQNNHFSLKITAEMFGGLGYFVSKQASKQVSKQASKQASKRLYNIKGTGARSAARDRATSSHPAACVSTRQDGNSLCIMPFPLR